MFVLDYGLLNLVWFINVYELVNYYLGFYLNKVS